MKFIDSFKILFSLVVVWIHTGVGDLGGLTPWAVPFFFTVSGFFLFGKLFDETESRMREVRLVKWWKNILRLYIIWSLIFLPFAIIGFYHDHFSPIKAAAVYLRNIVFVGENYLSWPLWYLLGLLWAGGIIWISNRIRIPFWCLCLLALFLLIVPRLHLFEENSLYWKLFLTTRNGLFVGFPFMVLGGLIRKILPPLKNWSRDSWQQKTALCFRYLSIHIYLSHMIWAGLLILIFGFERSSQFWGITCLISILTGLLLRPSDRIVKFLYGRTYRA